MSRDAYDRLTEPNRLTVDEHQTALRAVHGELARVLVRAQAVADQYNAESSAVYATMADADEIPNPTGLDGAAMLTKAETVSLQADLNGLIATGNDDLNGAPRRQNRVRAAGLRNTIG